MKTKLVRLVFFILIIATFATIFIFSNQNGEKSSSTSRGFTRKVVEILPTAKKMNEEQKEKTIENMQFVVRKGAHFSIYTVLGINLMGFINTYDKLKFKNKIIVAVLIGATYAVTDEFHQMFLDGRTPKIGDVCIDTCGVLFGICIVLGIIKIKNNLKTDN